ncbi:hypothetical protein [Nonomuraea endophytica]|uniref:Uncharacterized protein n=1 Tax=Nonomuraea endophytica TaxID=714136 RepID=A0A7W8A215_9ACTN|nr:hypothetical protein [Nonomuraea endophytica]MBB5078060.1 hypothetical protein [Nonomuraea endophytica]
MQAARLLGHFDAARAVERLTALAGETDGEVAALAAAVLAELA